MQLWRHHVVQLGAPDEGVEARLVVNDNTYFKWVFINHNEVPSVQQSTLMSEINDPGR